jgi:2-polyprenyl-3-methyl-5-hydroxy-6-metoxy-1,4-benzoquinol methylase
MTKQAEREFPLKVDPRLLYSKPYHHAPSLREFATALEVLQLCLPAGASILDLGCGPGWTSLFLARAGFDVVGVDISERMIEVARERSEQENAPAHFIVADMEELDLERRDFDGVLLFDALHHCPGHAQVLHRACIHLRPGGYLLLMEPSWLHLYSPDARAAARAFDVTELGFSRGQLKRELRRAGFRRHTLYHDGGSVYRGLTGLLRANVRLWCSYLWCFPRVKQILLAQK